MKASAHAVYDLKYHFVWIPKYRKHLLVGDVAEATKEILCEVAEAYGMDVDMLEVVSENSFALTLEFAHRSDFFAACDPISSVCTRRGIA